MEIIFGKPCKMTKIFPKTCKKPGISTSEDTDHPATLTAIVFNLTRVSENLIYFKISSGKYYLIQVQKSVKVSDKHFQAGV